MEVLLEEIVVRLPWATGNGNADSHTRAPLWNRKSRQYMDPAASVEKSVNQKLLFKINKLVIARGERVLVRGPSGKGKTTLLHLIAGLFRPDEGRVMIGGQNLADLSELKRSQLRRKNLSLVFQKLNLLPHLTALENVILALDPKSDEAEAEQTARQALKQLRMHDHMETFASDLSLGEQQRVAVARVIAARPQLVLADEPTSSLDDLNAKAVCDALFDLSKEATLIVVSHDHRLDSRFTRIIDFEEIARA